MARCTASSSNGSGKQCAAHAIRGGTVCVTHGGRAPQVKRKAEERLEAARQEMLELIEPALTRLRTLLSAESEAVQLAAVRDLLDRVGLGAKQKAEVEVTHYDGDQFESVVADLLAEFDQRSQSGGTLAATGPAEPATPDRS